MAVVNPFLVVKENVDKVILLATKRSKEYADRIKSFIDGHLIGNLTVVIRNISDNLVVNNSLLPAHEEMLRHIRPGKGFYFNIAGGMNFQIAACVKAIYDTNLISSCELLYPEEKGTHSTYLDKNNIIVNNLMPNPKAVDILTLQGIEFSYPNRVRDSFLHYVLCKLQINLPRDMDDILICDIFFDLCWNAGNTLKLLKVIHKSRDSDKPSKWFLEETRKLISLANDRNKLGDLYSEKIAVLTNIVTVKEHLLSEANGRIDVFPIAGGNDSTESIGPRIREFLGMDSIAVPSDISNKATFKIDTINISGNKSILYATIGKDLTPTLIALCSHKPDLAFLLYTSDTEEHAIRLKENVKHLPVGNISLIKTGINALEIVGYAEELPSLERTEFNITPGTKSHAAALSLISCMKKGEIFSLENKSAESIAITSSNTRYPYDAPNIEIFLMLKGIKTQSPGKTMEYLTNHRRSKVYNDVLLFLSQKTDATGEIIKATYRKKLIEIDSYENDRWFEELLGYAFLKCGADDVRVRIKLDRDKKVKEHLTNKYGRAEPLSEIDVVARFGAKYYCISCKSGKKHKFASGEIHAVSKIFGRYAIPLLAKINHKGEPRCGEDEVFVFGPHTFTNSINLKKIVNDASQIKKTTHE